MNDKFQNHYLWQNMTRNFIIQFIPELHFHLHFLNLPLFIFLEFITSFLHSSLCNHHAWHISLLILFISLTSHQKKKMGGKPYQKIKSWFLLYSVYQLSNSVLWKWWEDIYWWQSSLYRSALTSWKSTQLRIWPYIINLPWSIWLCHPLKISFIFDTIPYHMMR